jgi:uncharacterized membrane protein YhaH (DUF805 family)
MNQFIDAWKDAVTKNYANFSGRLGLGGYWRFFLVNIVIAVVLLILLRIHWIFLILYVGYILALLIPGLAAGVRRLHDTGKSGWFVLIALVPLVGTIILLVLLAQKGQTEDNTYGPPALAIA